ncbi:MAG: hypothetical protein M3Z08_03950 [Chloroflexota bacterium]|nr:hypothetical protein [Chloroflexota bacterium]
MQQEMDPRQSQSNWETPLYAHPEGAPKVDDRPYGSYGQGLSSQSHAPGSGNQFGSFSSQQPGGKFSLHLDSRKASAGQRLALAIVSVVMLVPLTAIAFGILQFAGLFAVGLICLTLVIINGIFNAMG